MTKAEAARKLKELAYEIYETLEEMEEILKEAAPEEFERAKVYWLADIDGALFNRKNEEAGILGAKSFISLEDTLASLEEEDDEDWDSEDDEEDWDDEDEDWDDEDEED